MVIRQFQGKNRDRIIAGCFGCTRRSATRSLPLNLADLFLYRIKQYHPDFKIQLASMYSKEAAIANSIAVGAWREGVELNVLLVREERRKFGLMNWMEGVSNGLPTVIVLDSANGHNEFRRCYEILKQQNVPLSDYGFCILNKINKDDAAKLKVDALLPQNMQTLWLFCLDDFGLRLVG